ncbi:hypothetical protein EHQ24_14260 [Leptospira noumeaensis]|uniref:Lipoprotein n=1 Tax=Leptospira noumeaensis TaxID=2484964 RepID=A0A4R9I8C7_9LEPT|nr:hypothetical protein [Leptospira noumeaensis]TGK82412.1 hypothetical protein EHQ24_14260 [Leptospira noumeaensis]
MKFKTMKNKTKNILKIFLILSLTSNCAVDIRQVPEPRALIYSPVFLTQSNLYIGKLEVYTSDSIEYTTAWRHIFKSFLLNNRISKNVKDLNGEKQINKDDYILDIEIYPKLNDEFNYWWTWPAIYPMSGYWPVQMRTYNYETIIKYKIIKNQSIIHESEIKETEEKTITMYGFYRTSEIEKMIEIVNLKALDKCSKEISLKVQ